MATRDRQREMKLIEEVRHATSFIRLGLRNVDLIEPGTDFYHAPLLLLSTGIERLMKCMMCMDYKQSHGAYPVQPIWPRGAKGHDIRQLLRQVNGFCIPLDGVAAGDYDILSSDERVAAFVDILSAYGVDSRYHELDGVIGKHTTRNAQREYSDLTLRLAVTTRGTSFYRELMDPSCAADAYKVMNSEVKKLVEQLVRALARQFLFGRFSDESKKYIVELAPFYKIADTDLGKSSY